MKIVTHIIILTLFSLSLLMGQSEKVIDLEEVHFKTVTQPSDPLSDPLESEINSSKRSIHYLEAELAQQRSRLQELDALKTSRPLSDKDSKRVANLENKVDELNATINTLNELLVKMSEKATQKPTPSISKKEIQENEFRQLIVEDSLQQIRLRERQRQIRHQLETVSLEINEIAQQAKDPDSKKSLIKKLKAERGLDVKDAEPEPLNRTVLKEISRAEIDVASITYVRDGFSLDKARLMVLESLDDDDVIRYYQTLEDKDRYRLYDLMDRLQYENKLPVRQARKTAIYFFLYTE